MIGFRFNNLSGYFPALYLTPWEGRRTPEHFLGNYSSYCSCMRIGIFAFKNYQYDLCLFSDDEFNDTPRKKELTKSIDSDEV